MEKIAHNTEQETISMHIITFVMLIFLPGTFIAVGLFHLEREVSYLTSREQTLLQSGIFQWKDLDTGGATWLFKTDAFGMFAVSSLVITFVTCIVCLAVYRCLRRRSRRRLELQDEIEASLQV